MLGQAVRLKELSGRSSSGLADTGWTHTGLRKGDLFYSFICYAFIISVKVIPRMAFSHKMNYYVFLCCPSVPKYRSVRRLEFDFTGFVQNG